MTDSCVSESSTKSTHFAERESLCMIYHGSGSRRHLASKIYTFAAPDIMSMTRSAAVSYIPSLLETRLYEVFLAIPSVCSRQFNRGHLKRVGAPPCKL